MEIFSINDIYSENDIYPYVQKLHRNEDDFYDGDIGDRIENFSKYQLAEIPINNINVDEYSLDDDYVKEYIGKYREMGGKYPPIVLGYYDSNCGYDIIDGTHRANALKDLGIKSIMCFVGLNKHQPKVL